MEQAALEGLRHYLRRAPVAQIAVVVGIAKVSAGFLVALSSGLIVVPVIYPGGGPRFSFTLFGFATLFGDTVDWIEPFSQLVSLAAILTLAAAIRSRTRSSLRQCPHCLTRIPATATVCFNCTRGGA